MTLKVPVSLEMIWIINKPKEKNHQRNTWKHFNSKHQDNYLRKDVLRGLVFKFRVARYLSEAIEFPGMS